MSGQKQIRVIIKGRVQGVFYRASTKKQADQLGIQGWVRNLPDGSVEALFQGDQTIISKMLAWCRQGPPASKVETVSTENPEMTERFKTFEVRY